MRWHGATRPDGFDGRQFLTLLRTMWRGEPAATGRAGVSGAFTSGRLGRNLLGRIGRGVILVIVFAQLAVYLCLAGMGVGALNPSPASAFVVTGCLLVVTSVMFGLYQTVNVLYYTSDMGYYLALPLSPSTVAWARLARFLVPNVLTDLAFFLSFALGWLWAAKASAAVFALMVFGVLCAAIATNLMLAMGTVLLMRFSRFARDRDRFNRLFGALIMVVALGIGVGVQPLVSSAAGRVGAFSLLSQLGSSPPSLVVLTVLCPPLALAHPLFAGEAPAVVAAVVGMVLCVILVIRLLDRIALRHYFDGIRSVTGVGAGVRGNGRHRERKGPGRLLSPRSDLMANLSREWAQIVRTPYFFNQFVLGQALMPVYLVAVLAFSLYAGSGAETLGQLRAVAGALSLTGRGMAIVTLTSLAIIAFMGFSTTPAFMAVSRDGRDFFLMRAMPMRWDSYLLAKFLLLLLVGVVPFMVVLGVILAVLGVPTLPALYLFALIATDLSLLMLASLGMGSRSPNLDWESEAQMASGRTSLVMVFGGVALALVLLTPQAAPLFAALLSDAPVPVAVFPLVLAIVAAELALMLWWVLSRCARSLSRWEP